MALADSMLKYGMQKIKMSQASSLGNTISKIGDLGMEAGAALTKVAKATESNRKSYETIQTGKKEVGIDDEGSFLEKTGLKSSLNSDKSFDVNTGGGKKVSYDMRGLKQIGTLSSVYNEDYLVKKYGTDESGEFTDWKEKFGVKSYWDKFSDNPDAEWQNKSEASKFKAEAPNEKAVDPYSIVPSGPEQNLLQATDEEGEKSKSFLGISNKSVSLKPIELSNINRRPGKGVSGFDNRTDAEIKKEKNDYESDRAKLGKELGDEIQILEQEEFANQLSRKLRQAAINPDYSGKFSGSSDSAYKNALGINLKNTKRSPFGIKNSNSMKINNNETIDVSFDAKKIEKRDAGRKIKSKETKPLEIENKIIDDFVKDSDGIIEEDPKEISSKKYKKISEEDGLNFAASDIDKKTGKTIYNLYNREGKNLGAIFSMKNGKMTKEDKEFFKNLKHFKGLEFPDLIQKIET